MSEYDPGFTSPDEKDLVERKPVVFKGYEGREMVIFLHPDNFAHEDKQPFVETPNDQQLPSSAGWLPREIRSFKNATLVDAQGVNVFYGDMSQEDIKRLDGYYVLREGVAFGLHLPEYAGPEEDTFDLNYVRREAEGAIVEGRWIENKK